MIQGFGQEITEIPAFGHDITEVRAMGELVWQKQSSIPDYLCFTALEAGQFTLTIPAAVTPTYLSYVEWSKDGRTWNHTDNTSEAVTIDVQVASGDKVYWRGSGRRMATGYPDGRFSKFSSTCQFDLSGDIRSILYLDDFSVTTTTQQYCFTGLFYGASVIDASNLRLALTGDSAYMMCFRGCTQLVHAPSLMEGGAIMHWQFHTTYQGCNRLVTGTDIQATSVASVGCYYTYRGCISLMKAPDISSVISVEQQGFYAMFYNCSSLNYVKCLASSFYEDDTASNAATYAWLSGVSSTGTFIQASGVTWPRGARGIPTGWVNVEKRTMPSGYKQVEYLSNPNKPSSTPMPLVETGIILDPSQDTFEIAVYPHFDTDGYIAHHSYGGMPFASHPSPSGSGAKVGRFYINFRAYANQTNAFSCAWTKEISTASSFYVSNKITENPQVLRIELSSGDNKMLLNGTQIASNTDTYNVSDMGTETAKLFGINNVGYNWIDPIYYMKWWRNGVLIADYVACVRESDNEPSFYDFVSNTFKVPTRTGFFTAGEEI